ncbi:TonB-dependent receptor [uncultured Selenomonas sp.]|uniref:TonB-dependent receptor plug domain-containing protein n=1 Tax=uncultured Selenomonas sp. TaxID=159275 RepID=UPI0028E78057|nr:TonB-dependent receptor [uncultured Selenomonas sp.]
MKKSIRLAVTAALTLGTLSVGGGQTYAADQDLSAGEHSLGETVVTATRTPNKELKANANITVITGKDIERRHYTDLTQALRDVPGVTVNQYAPAGYNNSTKFYINGSEDVVLLIDGVRQNYAGGFAASLTSALKDLSGIERIEVLHGSASTLYGSDAKGGVINIITKKAQGVKTTLGVSYGSYGRQLYSVANEGAANGWDWRVKYQKDKSSDFKDAHGNKVPSELDADSISLHLGKDLSKASYLALNFRSYKDSDRYQALHEQAQGLPLNHGDYDHFDASLTWNVQIDDTTKNQMSVSRGKYNYNLSTYSLHWLTHLPVESLYDFDDRTWRFSDQFDKQLGDHLLTAGFEFTKDDTTIKNGGAVSIGDRTLLNRSFYLQDQWSIIPTLKLTAGIRHDSSSAFGSHNSPSVSLGYDIDSMTHAYVSYSEYFITPTPNQLYAPMYGNANLKPESGNTKEIGIARDFGRGLSLTASYFMRHSKNRIGYHPVTYQNINVGDEDAHGWSLQLTKRMDSHWRTRLGYTLTHIGKTEQRGVNVDGYLPKDQWNIGLDYRNRDFDSSLLVRGIIGRPGPVSGAFPTNNYWVVDLAMNYQVADATKIYLKANNIFNQFYAEHSNVKYGAPEQWWTAPGRNFMIGVEQSF